MGALLVMGIVPGNSGGLASSRGPRRDNPPEVVPKAAIKALPSSTFFVAVPQKYALYSWRSWLCQPEKTPRTGSLPGLAMAEKEGGILMPSRRWTRGPSRREPSKPQFGGSRLDSLVLGALVASFVVVLRADLSSFGASVGMVGMLTLLLWVFWKLCRRRAALKRLKRERTS